MIVEIVAVVRANDKSFPFNFVLPDRISVVEWSDAPLRLPDYGTCAVPLKFSENCLTKMTI